MASADSLKVRNLLKRGAVGQVSTDTPISIRLRPTSAAGAVTSVTITTATNIVAITANGSTETWAFATYTTLGSLVDKINSSEYWDARILDGLRTDASASTMVDGAITATSEDGVSDYYDCLGDTSASLNFSYRIAYDRKVGVDSPKAAHVCHLQEIVYLIDVGTAAMDNFQIFEINGTVETQIYKALNVDNTKTTVNWASGEGRISTSRPGNELLVRIKDAATLADDAGNYLTVIYERE